MVSSRRFALPVAIFIAMALCGCGAPYRPVWLPDSSGFIYVAEETDRGVTRIGLYDLNQRTSRVLPIVPDHFTLTPGISPDGKRLALVRAKVEAGKLTAQVILTDLQTGAFRESKVFPFGESGAGDCPALSAADWSSNNDHVLVSVADPNGNDSLSSVRLGIFDNRNETLALVSEVEMCPALGFSGSSIAADGSGFLAFRRRDMTTQPKFDVDRLVFVDWSGAIHKLTISAATRAAIRPLMSAESLPDCYPLPLQAHWKGPIYSFPLADYRSVLVIDCQRRTLSVQRNEDWKLDEIKRMSDESIVSCAKLGRGEFVVEVGSPSLWPLESPIEIWSRKDRKRTTLVHSAKMASIHLAPDGNAAAVMYHDKTSGGRILVIDDSGSRVTDFAIGISPLAGQFMAGTAPFTEEPAPLKRPSPKHEPAK
jgi:hypothetical protein